MKKKTIIGLLISIFFICLLFWANNNEIKANGRTNIGANRIIPKEALLIGQPASTFTNTVFLDITASTNITLTRNHTYNSMGYLAIGQAWGDYNQDGLLDLYVTDNDGENRLYEQITIGSFQLSPLNHQIRLPNSYSGGANFSDYDNDGWPDLYVVAHGKNILFHNDNGLGFTDVTDIAGVGDIGKGETAAWGDYDEDGYLDLYVANWGLHCYPATCDYNDDVPGQIAGNKDKLYHNNGDGTFTDVTDILGVSPLMGGGFVASFFDYDNDGDLDIYLVNDQYVNLTGNVLWRNDGPGCSHWCFTEISAQANANKVVYGMGLSVGDYDNDGDLDLYFSSMGLSNAMTLLQNNGDGTFDDVSQFAGVSVSEAATAWGSVFADFNNDGWQDIYLAVMDMSPLIDSSDRLFFNNGDGTFNETTSLVTGVPSDRASMGLAMGDYNQDGWIDIAIGDFFDGVYLYQNQGTWGAGNHWVKFKLTGAGSINRDAIGSRIYLTTADGRTQMQELKNGSSLGAGNELALHFGLGLSTIEQVRILWPDGTEEDVTNQVLIDQLNRFSYPVTMKQFFPLFLAK